MKKSEIFFDILLIPIDILMIIAAFVVAYYLRAGSTLLPVTFSEYIKWVLLTIPIWILIFTIAGLYHRHRHFKVSDEIYNIIAACSIGIMVTVVIIFMRREFFFSRLIILYTWFLSVFFVLLGRTILELIQHWLFRYGIGVHKVLIIGGGQVSTTQVLQEIEKNPLLGYKPIGALDEVEKIGTVSGTTITYGSEVTFYAGTPAFCGVIPLYSEKFVVTYADASTHGSANVGTVSGPAIGISRETKTDGQTCAVTIKGISDVHSALTVGAVYYASPDGTLTTTAYPSRAGIAVSSTEILLDGRWSDQDQIFADLLFKNNFKVIESQDNGQSLSFMSQGNKQIMSLNENGNLSIPGFLKAEGLQIGQNSLVVATNGNVGIGTDKPTSKIDIAGESGVNQLRLRKPYTPQFQFDVFSNIGNISWDENNIYLKTGNGWRELEKDGW